MPVVSGMIDMRTEALSIHTASGGDTSGGASVVRLTPKEELVPSFGEGFIQRKEWIEEKPKSGVELRRLAANQADEEEAPRRGLFARIFGGYRR